MGIIMLYYKVIHQDLPMVITSLKKIYLTEAELKQAIINYIRQMHKEDEQIAATIEERVCSMNWSIIDRPYHFAVEIGGEIEDKK